MKCRACGADAASSSVFCGQCGTRLIDDPHSPLPDASAEPDATRPPESSGAHPRSATNGTGVLFAPGTAFGSRYRILRRLGQGGMGVVYQAWDDELGLAVALKVIRPEVLADPGESEQIQRRFKRELLVARQVTHKHVVRIHDLGEVNGVKYLTMPFIEGFDLGTLIRREGKLPVERALRLARQMVAGLAAAHEVGVIHRDLKPENIMVDGDDTAVIMDFGLARSSEGGSLTGTGAVMGTLNYMAPEQASGVSVDARADIYAVGLVIYDMLAGRRRLGQHRDAMSEMLARMQQPVPELLTVEPRVPAGFSAVVSRAVEHDREKRYQTVREMLAALEALDAEGNAASEAPVVHQGAGTRSRWALAALAAALGLTLAAGWWFWPRGDGAPAPAEARDPVTVLIADFDNRTGDPVFDGSLEQALTLGIEGASFITTYPRRDAERSAQQIKPDAALDEATVRLVCQREGIMTALAGTIVTAASGYEVSVRLIDPVPGTEMGRATERVSSKDQVLAAVARLSDKVRTLLGDQTTVTGEDAARETFTASSLEAAREYAQAQSLANANRDEEAIEHYRRATTHDTRLGRAYSGWALSLFKLGRRDEAEQLYKKAFAELDRMTEREKLRTLGTYYLNISGNYETAIENFESLVAKYPADGAALNNLAFAYFNQLQFGKAQEHGRRLIAIYPKSGLYRYNFALYAMYAGEFTAAASEGRAALEINPTLHKAYLALAMAALASGDVEGARAAYVRARDAGPRGVSLAAIGLADLAMHQGRFDEATALLPRGITEDESSRNAAGAATKTAALAESHLADGRRGEAGEVAERALKLGRDASVLVPTARVLFSTGRPAEALRLADQLDAVPAARSRAYARLLRALDLLERRQAVKALDVLKDAQSLSDLWLVRFFKGVAYVEAGAFADALAELELVQKRQGEATAVFLDDVPSFRYVVPVAYWLGRAHEGLGAADAAERHYRTYLALRSPDMDPLARDAARRRNAATAAAKE